MNLEFLDNLWFPLGGREKRQAEELALKAETSLHQLNKLPPPEKDERDLISRLQHISLLSERLLEQEEFSHSLIQSNVKSVEPEKTKLENSIALLEVESPKLEKSAIPLESVSTPEITLEKAEQKPSVTAQELMRLRDWILLATSEEGKKKDKSKVLQVLYTKLGKILEKEGITSLEETGVCNYERHQVVSTQKTDNPNQDELIHETVRPGYLFHGSLIRPQEVIVYEYKNLVYD